MILWGGCTKWLFDGGKKKFNFVYIYFISMYNNYWLISTLFVLAQVREEPQQEDERACEENAIITTISLHMMTKDLKRFVSFPSWEREDIVDRHVHV